MVDEKRRTFDHVDLATVRPRPLLAERPERWPSRASFGHVLEVEDDERFVVRFVRMYPNAVPPSRAGIHRILVVCTHDELVVVSCMRGKYELDLLETGHIASVIRTIGQVVVQRGLLVDIVDSAVGGVVEGLPLPGVEKVAADVGVGEDKLGAGGGYEEGKEREEGIASTHGRPDQGGGGAAGGRWPGGEAGGRRAGERSRRRAAQRSSPPSRASAFSNIDLVWARRLTFLACVGCCSSPGSRSSVPPRSGRKSKPSRLQLQGLRDGPRPDAGYSCRAVSVGQWVAPRRRVVVIGPLWAV